jgi:ketosteroid isomerase-like protein
MSAAENKALIQQAFAKWAGGDADAVFSLLADDVHWTVIGSTPVSRSYKSKREFLEGAVQPLTAQLATPIEPTVLDVIAERDKVAVQWDGRASAKNGKPYNQRYCWIMRLEQGRVREGVAYLDTELISQLWS